MMTISRYVRSPDSQSVTVTTNPVDEPIIDIDLVPTSVPEDGGSFEKTAVDSDQDDLFSQFIHLTPLDDLLSGTDRTVFDIDELVSPSSNFGGGDSSRHDPEPDQPADISKAPLQATSSLTGRTSRDNIEAAPTCCEQFPRFEEEFA